MRSIIFLILITAVEARLGPCPEINLPKWNNFDFIKTQGGTWYLTHMTNFEIGKDIDESIGCTNKMVVFTDDFKSLNYITMGFPQLKDVTQFNLTADVIRNAADNRIFTLQFLGNITWAIGPVYVIETDPLQYTLHWQCFVLNNQRVENFLLYSRSPNINNAIVEDVKSRLHTVVLHSTGSLEPITRCSVPP